MKILIFEWAGVWFVDEGADIYVNTIEGAAETLELAPYGPALAQSITLRDAS